MTRIAITTYYLAICVFLILLGTVVFKLTFWPVCTGVSACDGWTVAGLAGAILGVSAVFLGILGAIAVAAWWANLEKRVQDHVTHLFTGRIQTVQDTIDQLNGRVEELQTKVDAILQTKVDAIGLSVRSIEEMLPTLEQRISIAQQSAQLALDETLPPNEKALRDHKRRMQKITDQQEQSPDNR